MDELKEFPDGCMCLNGKMHEAITIMINSPYSSYTEQDLRDTLGRALEGIGVGAWRMKPQYVNKNGEKYIKCRVFVGKPDEFVNKMDLNF